MDVSKAGDDRGQALEQVRADDPAPVPPAVPGRVGGGDRAPPNQMAVARLAPVRLKKGAQAATALNELSGTVAVQVLANPEEYVTVDGILDAAGKTVKAADGGTLRVVEVAPEAGGKVRVRFGIDPPAGGPPGGFFHMTMQNGRVVLAAATGASGEYEVALVDAKGDAVPWSAPGFGPAGRVPSSRSFVSQSGIAGRPSWWPRQSERHPGCAVHPAGCAAPVGPVSRFKAASRERGCHGWQP